MEKNSKETSQRYFDAAIESYMKSCIDFCQNLWKSTCQRVDFSNIAVYMNAALQKEELFSQAFFKDFAYRFRFWNYGTAILEDNF